MKTVPRLIVLLAIVVVAFAATGSVASASTLKYSDEFTASSLNTSSWKASLPWDNVTNAAGNELERIYPANITQSNGEAVLKTDNAKLDPSFPYGSGAITSKSQAFSYGYYEMRAKLPKGQGVWPAFWLVDWYGTHEIDIFELLGNDPKSIYMTYHDGSAQPYSVKYTGPDFSAGYHTFGVDWQPTSITWYVDGVQRGKYSGTIKANPLMICANTAVGGAGSWPGATNSSTTFPQTYSIDYIRVYDTKPVPNTAPVANANSYSTANATKLTVAAPGLLGNDSDAQGDAMTASALTQPAHGTLSMAANGSFTYTPAAGFAGIDTFTYTANDGQANSAAATVSITVAAPYVHGPAATADTFSTNADTTLTVQNAGVLANDSDDQGHALTASMVTQPAHGTCSFQSNGSFVYVPSPGFSGTDTFTYAASDGAVSSAATAVSLSVVALPAPAPSTTTIFKPVVKRRTRTKYTVSGTVRLAGTVVPVAYTPAAPVAPVVLRVQVPRLLHNKWHTYGTARVVNPSSKYSAVVSLKKGTFRVRTVASGGSSPAATSSWTKAFRVR
jgi:VCBS repeat-containing protein